MSNRGQDVRNPNFERSGVLLTEDALSQDFEYSLSDLRIFGKGDYLACLHAWVKAFPDFRYENHSIVSQDGLMVIEATFHATLTGSVCLVSGDVIPPSGRTVSISSLSIAEIEGGLITRFRKYLDVSELAGKLGIKLDDLRQSDLWHAGCSKCEKLGLSSRTPESVSTAPWPNRSAP
ncbi:ester cyclase [Streptomyces chartreusis]|uniref:ester cyclase n=1 Tax=Streptomyces chartreusis TaxID=1969 RepID=UPI0037F279F1